MIARGQPATRLASPAHVVLLLSTWYRALDHSTQRLVSLNLVYHHKEAITHYHFIMSTLRLYAAFVPATASAISSLSTDRSSRLLLDRGPQSRARLVVGLSNITSPIRVTISCATPLIFSHPHLLPLHSFTQYRRALRSCSMMAVFNKSITASQLLCVVFVLLTLLPASSSAQPVAYTDLANGHARLRLPPSKPPPTTASSHLPSLTSRLLSYQSPLSWASHRCTCHSVLLLPQLPASTTSRRGRLVEWCRSSNSSRRTQPTSLSPPRPTRAATTPCW